MTQQTTARILISGLAPFPLDNRVLVSHRCSDRPQLRYSFLNSVQRVLISWPGRKEYQTMQTGRRASFLLMTTLLLVTVAAARSSTLAQSSNSDWTAVRCEGEELTL